MAKDRLRRHLNGYANWTVLTIGQSAALNGERKPGFACKDAGESHSRAGRASVTVRQADERSEGTTQSVARGPARTGAQPASQTPTSQTASTTNQPDTGIPGNESLYPIPPPE